MGEDELEKKYPEEEIKEEPKEGLLEENQEEKEKKENKLLKMIQQLKVGETREFEINDKHLSVTRYDGLYTVSIDKVTFLTFNDSGEPKYYLNNLSKLMQDGVTFEDLDLPGLDVAIDQVERNQTAKKENDKGEEKEEEKDETKPELDDKDEEKEEEDVEKEEEKEKVAAKMGIDPKKIFPVKKDSQFYKNHPGIFRGKEIFFYENIDGSISVGTFDEHGNPIEDKEHFNAGNKVKSMQPVVRLGNGRDDVKEEIPYQTLEITGAAKDKGEKDVLDRYIAVFKNSGGDIEFAEVEQPSNGGTPVAERIETSGRINNTREMNQAIKNTSSSNTPNTRGQMYDEMKRTPLADNGIQAVETTDKGRDLLREQIKADLTRTRGPMESQKMEELIDQTEELLGKGEDYEDAVRKVGIEEREQGGRTPGEKRTRGE